MLWGRVAFGRIHVPFAYEGIVRRLCRARYQTSNQQQPESTS